MKKLEFEVNAVTNLQAGDKLDDAEALQDRLNERVHLQNYGSGVSEVFILFSVVPHGSTAEDEAKYHPDDGFLELVLKLDKKEVMQATRQQVRRRMKVLLQEAALQLIPELTIGDFDADRFALDIQQMLEE